MKTELSIAKEAAVEAGNLILGYYKADYEIKDKGYHNPARPNKKNNAEIAIVDEGGISAIFFVTII